MWAVRKMKAQIGTFASGKCRILPNWIKDLIVLLTQASYPKLPWNDEMNIQTNGDMKARSLNGWRNSRQR